MNNFYNYKSEASVYTNSDKEIDRCEEFIKQNFTSLRKEVDLFNKRRLTL